MKQLAPIILFVYNRPNHLKNTIESLLKNELAKESELYIFADGAKNDFDKQNVDLVRKYINQISGFKKINIFESQVNKGLANSIILGISQIFEKYEKAIILEDDLQFSPHFLSFMNNSLDFYENNSSIFSISAYCPPIIIPNNYEYDLFAFWRINSWGWASWKNRWITVDWKVSDFDDFIKNKKMRQKFNLQGDDVTIMLLKQMLGKIDSWAIRFNYACFKESKINIYPVKSLIENKGADGSGSHLKATSKYNSELIKKEPKLINLDFVDLKIAFNFKNHFKSSFYRKIINFIKLKKFLLQKKFRTNLFIK